jgi:hypothetical protein
VGSEELSAATVLKPRGKKKGHFGYEKRGSTRKISKIWMKYDEMMEISTEK